MESSSVAPQNPAVPAYQIHSLDPDHDYPALSVLCTEIEAADQLGLATSEASLKAAGPERRRWVAECTDAPGQFLAHGWLQPQSPSRWYVFVAVHPKLRRQGLGSDMFGHLLGYGKEMNAQELAASIRSDFLPGAAFLQHHGFRAMGHSRFMKATPALQQDPPLWPAGFTVRSLAELQDLQVLVDAHNLCYASHWGHYENSTKLTVDKLQEWMQEYPDGFIPEGIFILFSPDGEIAGVTYGRLAAGNDTGSPKTRIVDSPGVTPAFRQLDLLRPLTLLTLEWLRNQGDGPIELQCWGEEEETIEIYKSLGFTLAPQDDWIEYLRK